MGNMRPSGTEIIKNPEKHARNALFGENPDIIPTKIPNTVTKI
jgi:hypothetical protein